MNNLLNYSIKFVKKNASTILTASGGAGVIATAVLAVKATPKAMRILEEAKEEKQEDLTVLEKVKYAGPAYIPAIITGAATIACIFSANILNHRQQAALTSAYMLLDNSYKEYKAKVIELYGEETDVHVKDEIAKDKLNNQNITVSDDKQLYFDEYSGRYFEATTEHMLRVENKLNRTLQETAGVYLNDYFEMVGLDPTDYGDFMGWSSCELYDISWSSWFNFDFRKVVLDDGLQCIIVSFEFEPTFDFENYC